MSFFEIPADEIRDLQLTGLRMLLYFDEFCRSHRLTYYMCGGCCIGAVRSGGFIPWDDDVDVFMPRRDYERLKELWQDTDQYAIEIPGPDLWTANQFLTIHDNHTTFIKTYQKDLDINHGVTLDVLPLDGCPEGFRRKAQKFWALLYSLFIVGKAPTNHGRVQEMAGKLLLALVPGQKARWRVWHFCERQMTRYPIARCKKITELCSGPRYMQLEYPKEAFLHTLRLPFEGHRLPVPAGYDTYLSMAFGNYMELPPEEERICHHEYEFMDLKTPYRAYRGIRYARKERK